MPGKGKAGGAVQFDLFAPPDGEHCDDRSIEELLNAYAREVALQLEEAGVPVGRWYVEPIFPGEFKACVVPSEGKTFARWTEETGWTGCVKLGRGEYSRFDYMECGGAPPVDDVVQWFLVLLEMGGGRTPAGQRKASAQYGLRERLQMVAPVRQETSREEER